MKTLFSSFKITIISIVVDFFYVYSLQSYAQKYDHHNFDTK